VKRKEAKGEEEDEGRRGTRALQMGREEVRGGGGGRKGRWEKKEEEEAKTIRETKAM